MRRSRLSGRQIFSPCLEYLEQRTLLSGDGLSPWHNAAFPADVNNDAAVSAIDALIVINRLNTNGTNADSVNSFAEDNALWDVDNNGILSPSDALEVIDSVNAWRNNVSTELEKKRANGNDFGSGTIQGSANVPTVSFATGFHSISEAEANSPLFVELTLSFAVEQTVAVQFKVDPLDAAINEDFVVASTAVLFAPGKTSTFIEVSAVDDNIIEDFDETFSISLTSASDALVSNAPALIHIFDDDLQGAISISDATMLERNDGQSLMPFEVSLNRDTTVQLTLNLFTMDDSATAGEDYESSEFTLTFTPSDPNSLFVYVPINGDVKIEDDELFFLAAIVDTGINEQMDAFSTSVDATPIHANFIDGGENMSDFAAFSPGWIVNDDGPVEGTRLQFEVWPR